jgi:hypothetical protein
VASAGLFAAKHVGGGVTSRALKGQVEGPLQLVPYKEQKDALHFVVSLLNGSALYTAPEDYTRRAVTYSCWFIISTTKPYKPFKKPHRERKTPQTLKP